MFIFLAISTFFNAIASIVSGVLIYFNDRKNLINVTFSLLCLFLAIWAVGYFFPITQGNYDLSLFSFRLLHVGAIFIAVAHVHFISALLNKIEENRLFIRAGYIYNFLILCFIPTKYFIEDVVPKFDWNFWAKIGPVYPMWLFVWLIYLSYSVYLLSSSLRNTIGIKRQQIKYILIGNILGYLGGATNYFLFFDININPYLNILTSAQIISLAYVIARYRFFELQYVILNIFKKIFSVFFSVGIGYFFFFLLRPGPDNFLYIVLILGGTVISFIFFEAFFNSRAFYNLFRIDSLEHFRNVIHEFRDKIVIYPSFLALLKAVKQVFCTRLGISLANIILLGGKKKNKYPEIIKYFEKKNKYLITEELKFDQKQDLTNSLLKETSFLGQLIFPIFHRENLIALFVLGEKPSQSPYTKEEIELLEGAAHAVTFALVSIFYNEELQHEVDKRTQQLREKAQELRKAYKQLETLDQSKDTFLSIASHELRTPMTVIKGYSEFLLNEKFGHLNPKQRDFQEKIFNNTKQLLELVNDLLDLSKLEAEKMVFNYEPMDIQKNLEEDISNFKILCEQKKIKLSLKVGKNVSTLDSDPDKFKRIITNLVGNAYKFTPEGGHIEVRADIWKENPKFIKFEVSDSGIGIAKENHEKVFEKFTQVTNYLQKSYSGTGLGLPIVKKIVEKFGGKIWVESDIGKGATFFFVLPIKHTEEIEKKTRQTKKLI